MFVWIYVFSKFVKVFENGDIFVEKVISCYILKYDLYLTQKLYRATVLYQFVEYTDYLVIYYSDNN